jgi:hypothetical protein
MCWHDYFLFAKAAGRRANAFVGLVLIVGFFGNTGCAPRSAFTTATPRCSDTVHTKLSRDKPTVQVSYTEPTQDQAGNPVTELAKTTIYYDLGAGRMPAKQVPSTRPSGGGQISETITVPVTDGQEVFVRICVTATDRHGNESPMTP